MAKSEAKRMQSIISASLLGFPAYRSKLRTKKAVRKESPAPMVVDDFLLRRFDGVKILSVKEDSSVATA